MQNRVQNPVQSRPDEMKRKRKCKDPSRPLYRVHTTSRSREASHRLQKTLRFHSERSPDWRSPRLALERGVRAFADSDLGRQWRARRELGGTHEEEHARGGARARAVGHGQRVDLCAGGEAADDKT